MLNLRIGSLCSGIGLMDLGLEWAGLGETVWQVEIKPECRSVLEHWWPHAERFEDVTKVGRHCLRPVDVIAFGSPCQDLSSAGSRAGIHGPKSRVFWDCARVVEEMRPEWVVFENVASGASQWVDVVRGELERQGYATLPVPIAASDCGAPHRRSRVFIVANADRRTEPASAEHAKAPIASSPFSDAEGKRVRARRTYGNSESSRRPVASAGIATCADWAGGGLAQPDMVRVVHGRTRGMDGATRRICALGNAPCPQQAEAAGQVVRLLIEASEAA